MQNKTIISILLIILIITTLFSGCSSQSQENAAKDNRTTLTTSTPVITATPTPTLLPVSPPSPTPFASWELSEHGKAFLQSMCFYMPDWTDLDALTEDFWALFIFSSFTSPVIIDDDTVSTICGITEYVIAYREDLKIEEMEVKISHETAKDYVRLAMGCELPDFKAAIRNLQLGRIGFLYDTDSYYIGVSDFGPIGYTFNSYEIHQDIDNTFASVAFDAFEEDPANVTATVIFTIKPADNANGFIITGKETSFAH